MRATLKATLLCSSSNVHLRALSEHRRVSNSNKRLSSLSLPAFSPCSSASISFTSAPNSAVYLYIAVAFAARPAAPHANQGRRNPAARPARRRIMHDELGTTPR